MNHGIAIAAKHAAVNSRRRLDYYRRIFSAYLTNNKSQLTFWHEVPAVNENFHPGQLGEYYMPFTAKADYAGHYDANDIPMLDYRGSLGLQYNPIAIAQYGLGNYNLFVRSGDTARRRKFLSIADWLMETLEPNPSGFRVWNHNFDWEYRDTLRAPWYSALAQGQGISVLVRAYAHTRDSAYIDAAEAAFLPMVAPISEGGVAYLDHNGDTWLEEYIVDPPTHILNGFIWATWGVYDYFLATHDPRADALFRHSIETLKKNLGVYDARFWSLYEQSGTRMMMMASDFYHALHITQLRVLYKLTGESQFRDVADRWDSYRSSVWKRKLAFAYKAVFKLFYY